VSLFVIGWQRSVSGNGMILPVGSHRGQNFSNIFVNNDVTVIVQISAAAIDHDELGLPSARQHRQIGSGRDFKRRPGDQ
jgi:hypothetical protein